MDCKLEEYYIIWDHKPETTQSLKADCINQNHIFKLQIMKIKPLLTDTCLQQPTNKTLPEPATSLQQKLDGTINKPATKVYI